MGKVYLADDPKLNRQVAIKVLTAGANDESFRHRFRIEAKAIATLKHPNIVELYDYSGEDAADLYLVMEFVPGLSLFHMLAHRGPLSEATVVCIGHELALALEHAHAHHVVHRDIKPENIMLNKGRVVLTDFGVVKAFDRDNPLGTHADRTLTQVLGTPGFMSPEQFIGKNIDARTDIFSAGVVLYNLTTSHLPFEAPTVEGMFSRLRRGKYADPREYNDQLSAQFADLLSKCLATKPKDRWPSAAQMRDALLECLTFHGVKEVRQELAKYDKNPAGHAVEQRERRLDVLVRDLKVALKDHNRQRARSLIQMIQALAPAEDMMREITGVTLDAQSRPVFDNSTRSRRRWTWLVSGMLVGTALGIGVAAALYSLGFISEELLDSLVELGTNVGF